MTLVFAERCKICKTKTKIIGGSCTLSAHQDRVNDIKKRKTKQKERKAAAAKQRVKQSCACGCWAMLRPGQSVAVVEVNDMGARVTSNTPINELDAATVVDLGFAGITSVYMSLLSHVLK